MNNKNEFHGRDMDKIIDAESLANAFYKFGKTLGDSLNIAIDAINDFTKNFIRTKHKRKLKELHTAEMDLKALNKSNNWRKLHGYTLRKKVHK